MNGYTGLIDDYTMEKEALSYTDLQQWMQGMILRQGVEPGSKIAGHTIMDVVNASGRLSAMRHLDIYRGSYIARLRECMRNQFHTLAHALEAPLFEAFADDYLATYPSQSYTLNNLGERFPAFLEETRPDAGLALKETWPDFMIELAKFEYAISMIFDEAADGDTIMADEATPDEQLKLAPVLHLFHHSYPVCKYYLDHAQKKEPELPFPEESHCAVVRQHYKLGLFVVNRAQYHFLGLLQSRSSLAAAMESTGAQFQINMAGTIWEEWRKHFIGSGFFVRG